MIDFSNAKSIVIPEGEVFMITRGDEILWRKQKYKKELLYIESTGTQYIDTNYIPNANTEVELVASGITEKSFSASASGTWFFGARAGYLNRAYGSYYNPTNKTFYYAFANIMQSAKYEALYRGIKTIHAKSTGLYIDGEKVVSLSASNFTAPVSLSLFGLNNNGSVISLTSYKIHSCRIWDNGTLVRDFIPVLDWDDKPCMYDKVSETLFYNQGTGEFIGDRPNYKTELSYIEGTGTEYIDTGATINTATDTAELVFQATDTTIYKWLFGEHDNNARFGLGTGDGPNKRNVAYGDNTYKVSDSQIYNNKHIFLANESGVFLDGVKIADYKSFSSTSTLYLFNLNLSGGNYHAKAIVWSYKHTRNGSLIRDLIPVLDWDDKACMYDKVSGDLFYNEGNGNFLYTI